MQTGFTVEFVVALGEGAQRVARRVGGSGHRLVGQVSAGLDELGIAERFQLFAQLRGRGDHHRLQRDHGLAPRGIPKRVAAERMVAEIRVVGDPEADLDLSQAYVNLTAEGPGGLTASIARRGRHARG